MTGPSRGRRLIRSRIAAMWLLVATVGSMLFGSVSMPQPVVAAGDTMRMEPTSSVVAKDATFKIRIFQNSTIATSGAQATVTFDPALVQLLAVEKGSDYLAAPVFAGVSADAIAAANSDGSINGVAAAFLPPGSVAPGDREFLVIELKAVGCGHAEIGLPVGPSDAGLLDGRSATYGAPLSVTASGATVTICDTMRLDPPTSAAGKDATVKVGVRQNATVATSGAQATITFDPAILQLVAVSKGAAYASAPVFTGVTPETIAAANTSGSLPRIATAFTAPGSVTAGDREAFVVEFKAVGCGTAEVKLTAGADDSRLLDGRAASYGATLAVTTTGATVTACDTMRIEAASAPVAKDATVKVKVVHNAEVDVSGAQATITFNAGLLRLVSVAKGSDYASAPVFAGVTAESISAANTSGSLAGIASAFLPPGSVAAGDREFLLVEFKAIGCGRAEIGLPDGASDAILLDGRAETYGAQLPVTPIGGYLTICGAPKPTPTPAPTQAPTPTPAPTPTTAPPAAPPPYVPPPYVPPPDAGTVAGATSVPEESFDLGPSPSPAEGVLPPSSQPPSAPRAATSRQWTDEDVAAVALVGGGVVGVMVALMFALIVIGFAGGMLAVMVVAWPRLGRRRR